MKQLLFEITSHRITASLLVENSVTPIYSSDCSDTSEQGYKTTLQHAVADLGDLSGYTDFSCSYSSAVQSLVPGSLFNASTPSEILNLTHQQVTSSNETDYNRLPEWSMVNVYYLPLWIKSVLVPKMPRIVIQHELSHVIRYLATGSTIGLKTIVIIHEHQFCVVIRKEGNIAHASYQTLQSAEDIVYHLLYCFQAFKEVEKGEIHFFDSTEKNHTVSLKALEIMKTIPQFNDQTIHSSASNHLKFQALCV